MELDYQIFLIDRDASVKIPVLVPEYEVPVLQAIHGDELVLPVEGSEETIDVGELTAAEAYNQLLRKYSQHVDAVKHVYRHVRDLAKESGLPYSVGDEAAAKAQQSMVRVGGKAKASPEAAKKAASKKADDKK